MNFYEKVQELQALKENKGAIVLVRCGIFFSAIGKDGVILSQLYGYTPVCFKEEICKCGAPVGVVDKLVKKIAKDKRALVIYDYDKNKTEEKYTEILRLEGTPTYETRNCTKCEECWYKKNRIIHRIDETMELLKQLQEQLGKEENNAD